MALSGKPGHRCCRVLDSAADSMSGLKVAIPGMSPFEPLEKSEGRSQCLGQMRCSPPPTPFHRPQHLAPAAVGGHSYELLMKSLDVTSVGRPMVTALFLQTIACHAFSDIFIFLPVCVVCGGKPSVGQLPNYLDVGSSLFFPLSLLRVPLIFVELCY